jgi:regulatory protein
MPLITALVPHPRKAGRVDVLVDGRSAGAVPADAVARLGLHVGGDFGAVQTAVEQECALLAAWDRATGLLAARARGRTELRRLMLRRGVAVEHVDPVLDRLEHAGYLNDVEFAREFARSRLVSGGQARRRVQQELLRRGVARDTVDEAIGQVLADEAVDGASAAERLARRKLRSLTRCDEGTRRRRLYGFLARRGFEGDEIREVMARLGEELQGE